MHLITYRKGSSKPRVGALVGEAVLDLGALAADLARERGTVRHGRGGFPKTMLELIGRGPDGLGAAREALAHGEALLKRDGVGALGERKLGLPADKARLEAPIPRPARNVFCLGRNYKEHAAERGAEAPTNPVYFTKAPECVLAPGGKIVHHAVTQQLDYEVELTVVIGTAGRDIPREQALSHVFGYTIVNDVTARDLQKLHGQWFKGKSLDTFCPMGPVLVTADEIPDPQTLAIAMRVNGETRQSSHTSKMIFPVDECIAVLSQGFTLLPGDVIATARPRASAPRSASSSRPAIGSRPRSRRSASSPTGSSRPDQSAEQILDGDCQIGEGDGRDPLPALERHHLLVRVGRRHAVDVHTVRHQIQDPGLGDGGARVERHPHPAVYGQTRVCHLDEEQDVGRHRVRRRVKVRARTQQRHIWLGLGVLFRELDGVLDLDNGALVQPRRPETVETVHRAGVARADRLAHDDLPGDQLDRLVLGEDSGLADPVVLV